MAERLVRIDPNGNVVFLHDDAIPILGEMNCRRASDVVFDHKTQTWEIQYKVPGIQNIGGFFSRKDAIDQEVRELEKILTDDPERIEKFMEET